MFQAESVRNSGTGNALTSYLVCITSKQAVPKWERKQSLSCTKVRFSSPESMMEDLPFFCGWGWDFSLSLEKKFEGAAVAILWWISFDNRLQQSFGFCSCKTQNTVAFCLFFSWNFIGYVKLTLKSDWLFCFVPFSEKKMRFRAKNGATRE